MLPGADNFTTEEQHYYDYSMKVVLYPGKVHPEEWELINTLRNLWYGRSKHMRGEMLSLYQVNLSCLNKQNVHFTRYAFCLEFPVADVELSQTLQINDYVDALLHWADAVLSWLGSPVINAKARLKTLMGFTEADALYWLRVLVVVTLKRYEYPILILRHKYIATREEAIALVPVMKMMWGEIPDEFINIIMEKTGLEGDELQDEVDRIVFEVIGPLPIPAWIEEQYRIQAERNEKIARFRMYLLTGMVAALTFGIAYNAYFAALAKLTPVEVASLTFIGRAKLVITSFIDVVKTGFSSFLTKIHYKTLLGVHKIAMLVSADYRAIMSKVYGEITRVSEALGYGPYTLMLLIENSRNLVLDVSTTMGMRYDLAEVQWLSSFQGYMKKFSGAAYKYRDNPEALLYDMTRWVQKDALDLKGAFMGEMVESVSKLLDDTAKFVGDLVTIRSDINKLVMDLPEELSKQIGDAIDPYVSKFDDFITDKYDPGLKAFNEVFDTIKAHQAEIKTRADELAERLKKPADYLLEIDALSDEERLDQETKFDDVSNRVYNRNLLSFSETATSVSMEMKRITGILTRPLELALLGVEEVTSPVPGPIGEIDPSKTWFVGDF